MNVLSTMPQTSVELSPRRLALAYWSEIRCEFLRLLRNPGYALPMLLVPVGIYVLFALVISSEAIAKDPDLGIFLFSAFAVMAVSMPALFGIAPTLALEREMRLFELRRALPAPTGSWLVAKLVVGVAYCVLSYLPMLLVAVASGKLALDGRHLLAFSAALLLGSLPFCALGLLIGALFSGSAAPAWANLIYLPGCYLSGMFFPLPKSLHWQVPLWPQFHVGQLAMHAASLTKFQFVSLSFAVVALLAFTVTTSAAALWRLQRKG